jgi:hypothetical protein
LSAPGTSDAFVVLAMMKKPRKKISTRYRTIPDFSPMPGNMSTEPSDPWTTPLCIPKPKYVPNSSLAIDLVEQPDADEMFSSQPAAAESDLQDIRDPSKLKKQNKVLKGTLPVSSRSVEGAASSSADPPTAAETSEALEESADVENPSDEDEENQGLIVMIFWILNVIVQKTTHV